MKSRFLPAFLLLFSLFFAKNLAAQTNFTVQIVGDSAAICLGNCAQLQSVVLGSPIPLTYAWYVADASGANMFLSTSNNLVFCPQTSGVFKIILIVTNNDGVTASDTIAITVLPYQSLNILSSNPAPCNFDSLQSSDDSACEKVCPNTTVTYSVQTSNPPGSSQYITWQVTGSSSYVVNTPFNNSVTVSWGGPGVGSVAVVANGGITGLCSGEDALCVTVIAEPLAKFTTDPAPTAGTIQICKGQTVYFENQSTGADGYEWSFSDDLSTSFEVDPQHVFQNAGNFTVRLIARSDCLCADTTTLDVEVLDAVAPSLDCVGTICPGATVTYTASNACPPYAWSVSPHGTVLSGGTSASDSIAIQWNDGPEGVITLGAQPCSGNACPNPASIRVPVISDDAEIRGEEQVCPSAVEIYSIEPYGGTGFVWTLSGGGTITEGQGTNRVSVEWTGFPNANTTYWLSVKYDNCYLGCGGEDSIAVKVLSPFVVNGPVELCEGASGNFSSKLTYNAQNLLANWTLFAPDGSAIWNSPAPTASANVTFSNGGGIYRLLAEPANPALTCSEQADWAVNIAAMPAQPTAILGEKNICPGTTYTYEAAGVLTANNLLWTVQNGAGAPVVSFGNKINVTWGTANPRWISVAQVSTNGLNCTSDTALLAVQSIGLISINGPQIVCEDSKASYSIIPLENVDIQWGVLPVTTGAVASGQGSNAVEVFWSAAGGYIVSLDVCGQTTSLPVTVLAPPDPMVQFTSSVCPGQISPVQTTSLYASYSWRDAAGVEMATTPTANLAPGSYAVHVQDPNGCAGATEFTIAENPAPNVSLTTADPTGFCNNSQYVTLTALANADGDFTYQWFQNGVPVGSNSPTFTTNQYGAFTVKVTNASGCTAMAGPIVTFNYCGGGGGGAGIPGSGVPLCPPGSVDFSINATAACDSFHFQLIPGPQYQTGSAQWTFGVSGGIVVGTSALENPGFHFPNAGKYIALLRAMMTDGSTCVVVDSVNVAASAQFTATPDCAGEATAFQDVSTFLPSHSIADWQWIFGDPPSGGNNFSNIRNPSHIYSNSGNALVTLTITANNGCTSSASQTLAIPGGVPAPFAPPALQCADNALEFSANAPPGVTQLEWNFGDLASGAANDATGNPAYHTFSATGNFAITTTTTNTYGCTAAFTQIISIDPNTLLGNISPANPAPICEGASLALTAPAGAVSYLWSDGATTTQIFTANEEGSYSVTLTDANGCTYVPPPVNVEIVPSPDALIKALLENELDQIVGTSYPTLATCEGEDVRLIVQANGAYNFVWSGGNGFDDEVFFDNEHNSTLSVGNHIFTVTVTDVSSGCTSVTDPFAVTVNPVPNISPVTASGNCAGIANVLTYTGSAPANWQFIWNNGALGTMLTTDEAGQFFIRVINEFGCEAKSNPVTILPGPNVAAIPGGCHARCRPDTLCLPLIPNIVSWQWYLDGNPIPGANSPNFVATQSGSYFAELTDIFGCTNQSDPLTLDLFDGFGNITGQVWSDVNGNGAVDAGDTLVSGIFVNLLQNGNPAGAGQSASNGGFSFVNVLASNYVVEIDAAKLPPGWGVVVGQNAVTLAGCNAAGEADLLLRFCPTSTSTLSVTACAGEFYDYNGVQIAAGATQDFTFQNQFGCDSTVTVTVGELPISASQLNVKVCPGTFYDYNGAQLAAGATQDFTFQNQFGCDSTVTLVVGEWPSDYLFIDAVACEGDSFFYNGVWIPAGTSQVFSYLNSFGCESFTEVAVFALPTHASTLQAVVCPGETFQFNGQQLAPGTTTEVTLANIWGCDSVVTVTVTELSVESGLLEAEVCPGETYSFNGTEIAAGDTVVFHFTTPEGCDSALTLVVTALPEATFDVLPETSCATAPSGSLTVTNVNGGLPPYRFSLDGTAFQDENLFEKRAAGAYTIYLEDSNGCIFEEEAEIPAFPPLTVGLSDGILPCDTSEILLELALGGDLTELKIKWFNGDTTTFTRVSEVGPVWVEVTNHCETVRREAAVNWEDLAANASYVYVPNVFKPASSDPDNSEFKPYFQPDLTILDYRFEVFDRWGNKMFSTEQPDLGWRGVFRADDMNPGVYVWYVQAKIAFCGREREMMFEGDVTVVR
jgi:PKD repeat protein